MAPIEACPRIEQFQVLVQGQPLTEEMEPLIEHLEQCDGCAQSIQQLASRDTLDDVLRQARSSPGFPIDGKISDLMDRLLQLDIADPALDTQNRTSDSSSLDLIPLPSESPEQYSFLSAPEANDEIGRLGQWRILRVLGSGGMGVVFEAEDPNLRRRVALKVMRPGLNLHADARLRFIREAQAMAAIEHDHVVTVHHVDEVNGVPYFTMPLLRGEPLNDRLRREGRLGLEETIELGKQISLGLAAAHEKGVIHRDIKPGNVWLEELDHNPEGPKRVKILDFGLTRVEDDQPRLTQAHDILGTPGYSAPEQVSVQDSSILPTRAGESVPHAEPGPRSDLFSLGCVLYHVGTGEPPFAGRTVMSVLSALLMTEPKAPHELNETMPLSLSKLIVQLLSKDPEGRPESAQTVIEEIEEIEHEITHALEVVPASPPSGRSRLPWITAALLLILLPLGWFYGAAAYRFVTKRGQVVIQTDRHVKVEITQGGKQIRLIDTKSNRSFDVAVGEYDIVITEKATGITTHSTSFSVSRGGERVIDVKHELSKLKPPLKKPSPEVADPSRSPFDTLDPKHIDPAALKAAEQYAGGRIEGLVAILGEHRFRHWERIYTIAYDPRGKHIATAGHDGVVRVWDLKTGDAVHHLTCDSISYGLAWSPDGRFLVGWTGGSLVVWDSDTGKRLHSIREATGGYDLSFSRDGKKLAIATGTPKVLVVGMDNGKPGAVTELNGHVKNVYSVAMGPQGKRLISGASDYSFNQIKGAAETKLWDLDSGKEIVLEKAEPLGLGVAFSPSGDLVASCGEGKSASVKVWNAASGKLQREWLAKGSQTYAIAFSPDGSHLLTSGTDWKHHLWSTKTGELVATVSESDSQIPGNLATTPRTVAFHPHLPQIATLRRIGRLRLWDYSKGRELFPEAGEGTPWTSLEVRPANRGVLLAQGSGEIQQWVIQEGRFQRREPLQTKGGGGIQELSLSRDGDWLAVGFHRDAQLWNLPNREVQRSHVSIEQSVTRVRVSPVGDQLAVGEHGELVQIVTPTRPPGDRIRSCKVQGTCALAYSPDGKKLAVGSYRGPLFLVDAVTGGLLKTIQTKHKQHFYSVRFSPDGKRLATTDSDFTLDLRDAETGDLLFQVSPHGQNRVYLRYSPDGRLIATSGADGTIAVWNAGNLQFRKRYRVSSGKPTAGKIRFSEDGRHLLVANGNGTAYVLRLPSELVHKP